MALYFSQSFDSTTLNSRRFIFVQNINWNVRDIELFMFLSNGIAHLIRTLDQQEKLFCSFFFFFCYFGKYTAHLYGPSTTTTIPATSTTTTTKKPRQRSKNSQTDAEPDDDTDNGKTRRTIVNGNGNILRASGHHVAVDYNAGGMMAVAVDGGCRRL